MEENQKNKHYGALWFNKSKISEKAPILTGNIKIEDKEFKVSVWKQEDRSNNRPDYKICISPEIETAKEILEELN